MNALVALLTVESLTAHPLRKLELVEELASELKVDLRQCWRPDAEWLASYQKIQLSHLMGELKGPVYRPDDERRKKSELVERPWRRYSPRRQPAVLRTPRWPSV